ncbi:MAG: hypothetical protein HND48_17410 [Chloroflexi bacterium]|nr:hypothetical protein [Chloroflexota bacterium]
MRALRVILTRRESLHQLVADGDEDQLGDGFAVEGEVVHLQRVDQLIVRRHIEQLEACVAEHLLKQGIVASAVFVPIGSGNRAKLFGRHARGERGAPSHGNRHLLQINVEASIFELLEEAIQIDDQVGSHKS